MTSPLQPFLSPQSVAIIGVSPNPSFINAILNNCIRLKYPGQLFPVNPNYQEISGLKAYPRLSDVPADVELALVSVPSRLIVDVLAQCEAKRVKAINILTSGFEELGGEEGARRHRILTDFVQRTSIRIVGPNCFGNLSAVHNFPGMAGTYPQMLRGVLSIAFQSGGLAINIVQTLLERQIGMAHAISTGNEADVEVADCLKFLADDPDTQVIGAFVEQFHNPQKFLEAAEMCASAQKPIVMIKVGRSEAGARAAQAHTGSLAGSDAIIDAMLRKVGVLRVYSLDELIETMAIMHARKMPLGDGVGAITFSGGAVGVISDMAADYGVQFPPFAEDGRQKIRRVLYEYGTVNNPIDLTGQAVYDPPVQQAGFEAMGEDPNLHTILIFGANVKLDAQSPIGKVITSAIKNFPDKLFIRTSGLTGPFREKAFAAPDPVEPIGALDGVPFLQGVENTLRAVRALQRYAAFQRQREGRQAADRGLRLAEGGQSPPRPAQTGSAVRGQQSKARAMVRAANGRALTESEGKALLALYGIASAQESLATSADDAARMATAIGFPVALKIASPQIMHKTEAGGVVLNVASADEARAAFERIMANARRYSASADLQGVSVQEMMTGGYEMIVGMTRDPQFGPGILLGLGGIFVEVLKDVVMRVPPLTADDAREMIDALKGVAILKGARGKPPADLDALVDTLQKFSQLCLDLKDDVSEIDINPLVVLTAGKGVRALDCLIVPVN